MDAAPPDGWTGSWQVNREAADGYGVQLDFRAWGDGSSTNGHVVIPAGEPPFSVTREAGTFILHGTPGERSGVVTFLPDCAAVAALEARAGTTFTPRQQLGHALFNVTLAFERVMRALLPAATFDEVFKAQFFGADEAFVQAFVAEHPDATPRALIGESMRRLAEANTTASTPKLTGVCTLLQVFDMVTSIRFYAQHLGFVVAEQAPVDRPYPHVNWVRLVRGSMSLMLNTAYEADQRPASRDPQWIASHRDVCLYFECPDVDEAYATLRERGLDLRPPSIAHYGMKQLSFSDPDGYLICLQWPA
jgi:glyoxylase I family protein